MKVSNKRKCRIKVIASKRHNLSSSRHQSLVKTSKTSCNYKRRITALLNNNRSLALALQDSRSELSEKQQLLQNATKHFKNIMQARILMLEMHSSLKSFVKKFDDALSLLNVDDIKISDLVIPFQSCKQFKRKMKDLAESVQEVSEETSFSVTPEKVNRDSEMCKTLNQIIPCDYNPTVDSEATEVTNRCNDNKTTNFEAEHCLPLQVCIKNTNTFNAVLPDVIDTRPPVEFSENLEEIVNTSGEKTVSPTKKDNLKDRESSGTPRLSIPNINTLQNSERLPDFKTCLSFKVPSSPGKIITNVLNTHVSSSKVWSSKIPKLHNLSHKSKLRINVPDDICKESDISSEKALNTTENLDVKVVRRKTFVVKNNNTSATNSESNSTSDKNEIRNENDFITEEIKQISCRKTFVIKDLNIPRDDLNSESNSTSDKNEIRNENDFITEETRQISCRKTFVIKDLDIPKDDHKSISNHRKTFVKKPTNNSNKIRKSMKNRRVTFVKSDIKENSTNNENVSTVTEISTSNDLVKDNCQLSEKKLPEDIPIVCDEANESLKNIFQENIYNMDIPSSSNTISLKEQSEQISCEGKDTVSKSNKITLIQEFKLESGSNCNTEENLHKVDNVNKKLPACESNESSEICITSEKFALPDDLVKSVDVKCWSRPKKRMSYKEFSESSDSDVECLSNLDFSFVKKPSVIPIRKRVSGSQKKKVFVFNAHKRKSVQNKKSLRKPKRESIKHSDFVPESSHISQSDNVNIKNIDVIESKCEVNEKIKCISHDSACNMSSNNIRSSEHCETSSIKQEILQSTGIAEKDAEMSGSVPSKKLSVSKIGENNIKNSLLFNSPVIASHKFLDTIEYERDNLNCGEEQSNIICKAKIKSVEKCSKSDKNSNIENDPLKCTSADSFSLKKSTKKNNSKKQSEQTIAGDVQEINEINTLIQNQNQEKETKKNDNNNKKKKETKTKRRKKSPTSCPSDNTIIVQAEVHSPPQEYFPTSKTACFNKENKSNPDGENCLVLLNDIFKSTNVDVLSLGKNKIVCNGRNSPVKIPLSDNSRNILASAIEHVKKEENIANNVKETRYSKRIRNVKYTEPSLRKKMRQ